MYIDLELEEGIRKLYGEKYDIESIVEDCGIWYTFGGIKAEYEDEEMTLEDAMNEFYYIVDGDRMMFTFVNSFLDDVEEFIKRGEKLEKYYKTV